MPGTVSNRTLVARFSGIPEYKLASLENSPDDWFFWCGPEEWEVVGAGDQRSVVTIWSYGTETGTNG